MSNRWRGIFTILLTPFDAERSLDVASLRREVDFVIAAGAHGIVTPVNTSEFFVLSDDERRAVTAAVVDQAAGRVPVVIGVAASNASTAAGLAQHAREHGASGVIAMPPFVVRHDARGVQDYYARIARAAGDLAVVVQNVGGEVGAPMSAAVMLDLASRIPTIRYVKEETSPSTHAVSELLRLGSQQLDGVFGGSGGRYLVDELKRGACGLMSGCHLVDAQVRVYEAFQSGDEAAARAAFYRQLPAQNLWSLLGLGLAKEILRRRAVFTTTVCRRPVVTLDQPDIQELEQALELVHADLLSPVAA